MKHDFSASTIDGIFSAIGEQCAYLENAALTLDSVSLSVTDIGVTGGLEWHEITSIRRLKDDLYEVVKNGRDAFGKVVDDVGSADRLAEAKLKNYWNDLAKVNAKLVALLGNIHCDINQPDAFANLKLQIGAVAAAYNTVDISQLSEEEREQLENYLAALKSAIVIEEGYSQETQTLRDEYIALYEALHPDEAKAMETFFANSTFDTNLITDEDIRNIKYLAYTSEGNYHTLLFAYIDQCKFTMGDGYCYDSETGTIYIDTSDALTSNGYGPYHGFFEEIGHNIDDLMYNGYNLTEKELDNIMLSTSSEYKERLWNAMQQDVKSVVEEQTVIAQKEYLTSGMLRGFYIFVDRDKVVNAIMSQQTDGLNLMEQDVYNKALAFMSDDGVAFDTYGAVLGINWGHDWDDDYDVNKAYSEITSQYFANGITNQALDDQSRELLPETYKILDEMIEKKVSEIRSKSASN